MAIKKRKPSDYAAKTIAYLLTAVFALICVLPMWHVIMSAFSDPIELNYKSGFIFKPVKASFEGLNLLSQYSGIWRSYLNTVFYTFAATALGIFLSLIAAYVLTRRDVFFGRPIMIYIIITMLFSGGMIPFYIVVKTLNLTNTALALIIPSCCNAMSIIMIKNGMETVPDSISEAAMIDGAGHFRILWKIIIPMTTSFTAVVILFNAIGHWNAWVNASMFISKAHKELYPLQLVMRDILINNSTTGVISASGYPISFYIPSLQATIVLVGALPLLILYPFVQKYFEKGIIIGGVKG